MIHPRVERPAAEAWTVGHVACVVSLEEKKGEKGG